MTRKLDLRYPGFRYHGEVEVQADQSIAIDSPALAEALSKELIPVGPRSKTDASNIEISAFSIDDAGRVILTSPDLFALLENTSFNNIPLAEGDIDSRTTFNIDIGEGGWPPGTNGSGFNQFCSSIYNDTCVSMVNDACS